MGGRGGMAMIGYVFIVLGILGGDLWIKDRIEKSEADEIGRAHV